MNPRTTERRDPVTYPRPLGQRSGH